MEYGFTTKRLPLITSDGRANQAYYADGTSEHDPAKQKQRERIYNLFLEFRVANILSRYLTFPGQHWAFERYVNARMDGDFVGLEHCWPIAERGQKWMPHARVEAEPAKVMKFNKSRTPDSVSRPTMSYMMNTVYGPIHGIKTSTAKVINLCASTFLNMDESEVRAPKYSRGKDSWYIRTFRDFAGVWLDFTSGACAEVMDSLMRVYRACSDYIDNVPVAITLMMGRDTLELPPASSAKWARVDFATKCLSLNNERRPLLVSANTYRSERGVTMLAMEFVMERLGN